MCWYHLVQDLLLSYHTTNPGKTLLPASERPPQNILCHRYSQHLEVLQLFLIEEQSRLRQSFQASPKTQGSELLTKQGENRGNNLQTDQDQTSSMTPLTSHPKTGSDVPSTKKLQGSKGSAGETCKSTSVPTERSNKPKHLIGHTALLVLKTPVNFNLANNKAYRAKWHLSKGILQSVKLTGTGAPNCPYDY